MPASPSSPLSVLAGRVDPGDPRGLLRVLAGVPDPRARRGKRHELVAVLAVAVSAGLAGARSYAAVEEWAADAPVRVLAELGRVGPPPSLSTIKRVLRSTDATVLSRVVGGWLQNRAARRRQQRGQVHGRRVVAVDGKAVRGARIGDTPAPHLLAVIEHGSGIVLGQVQVDGKSNEISSFPLLLDNLDLAGTVVTADALHTQRGHVTYLADRHADWVLTVKGNQKRLLAELRALPFEEVDVAWQARVKGHGRIEERILKVVTVSRGIGFPHAAQAIQIIRRSKPLKAKRWDRSETVYAITSLTAERVQGAELAAIMQGHWEIENRLHWVRDVTFDEDRSQIRAGQGPAVMATIRNVVISLGRLLDEANIAAWLRRNSHDFQRPIAILNSA